MADDAAGAAEQRPPPPETLPETAKAAKTLITIPSYPPASSSSSPSNSFSEAFSFIKSSEFYTPPAAENAPRQAEAPASASTAPKSAYPNAASRNAILVSHRQKGNPLLKHIRNVRWMFADVVCDYLIGQSSCALYLSLRYHLLHPDYLYFRIRELQKEYRLRVVLCHVDVEDVVKPLLEVTKTALLHDCTLLCGWSLEECGRYLETIKVYENKSADSIKERMDTDYMSRLNYALTSVRHVNKSDVVTLGSTFGSLSNIMDASMEDLARCPGIGDRKVKRLHDTFHEPFKRVISSQAAIRVNSNLEKANEDTSKEESGGRNESEEAPKITVKSALSAAFAKYNKRVKKDKEILNEGLAQTSDSMNTEEKSSS